MGLFDSIFGKTVNVREVLFAVNTDCGAVDEFVRLFGNFCREVAKSIPVDRRDSVVYRISVDRNNCSATFSIDVGAKRLVNLRKIIPGYLYADMLGWQSNENYIEGTTRYIGLPDQWDGLKLDECIIREFKKTCATATVVNSFDDVINSRLAGVVFAVN